MNVTQIENQYFKITQWCPVNFLYTIENISVPENRVKRYQKIMFIVEKTIKYNGLE